MVERSRAGIAPAVGVLLIAGLTGCGQEDTVSSPPTVQSVVDSISQTHYRDYHLAIENMGLGLYGGAEYDMGYREARTTSTTTWFRQGRPSSE